jgi:hypothetical protein
MIIYARVVAKPVNFPTEVELRYETLDEGSGKPTAVFGSPNGSPDYCSWEDIRRKFSIGDALASECEALLRQGKSAMIAPAQQWEGDWEPSFGYVRRTKDESKPSCSFCHKPYDLVGRLIASSTEPRVYICDECVAFLAQQKTPTPE